MRIIAATHQDLEAAVERGTFREGFYYRLSWVMLEVPPLRERREDIAPAGGALPARSRHDDGLHIEGMSRDAMAMLDADDWPANVRELETAVKPAMIAAGFSSPSC